MRIALLAGIVSVPVLIGIGITWLNGRRMERGNIASRLARLRPASLEENKPVLLLKPAKSVNSKANDGFSFKLPDFTIISSLLTESGFEGHYSTFLYVLLLLAALPLLVATLMEWNILIALLCSAILAIAPIIYIKINAEARRVKFSEQLPDAIDLMVAVLRSGHSVPQAVKSVALEIPSPCGEEFETVLHRINLGQALPESLTYSSKRFRSYELDLMQRAVAIQAEVGGSLAEILDKTNFTLRQRLKLSRQLRVITAQSRLSARIVALLPIVLAVVLNFLNPGYLGTLLEDKLGQMLLCASILLELIGIFVMERMSTMRI